MKNMYARGVFALVCVGASVCADSAVSVPLVTVTAANSQAIRYVGNMHPENGRAQLELLLREGLQPGDYVVDIGCGALVAGIPTMAYVEPGHFVGVEPNKWLIDNTLLVPANRAIVDAQSPVFLYNDSFDAREIGIKFDYIIAHSIMSHAADWQLDLFLVRCADVLKDGGKVIVSLRLTEPNEFGSAGAAQETNSATWVYPGNSYFDKSGVEEKALRFFSNVELKREYTAIITQSDKGAFHDWFVLTK